MEKKLIKYLEDKIKECDVQEKELYEKYHPPKFIDIGFVRGKRNVLVDILERVKSGSMSVNESTITNPKKQLEFYKDLLEQLQQENKQLKEQLKKTNQPEIFIDTEDMEERYGTDLYIEYLEDKVNQKDEAIDEAIRFVKSLSSKGRDCMIYADVKKDILDKLQKYKGDNK